MLKSLWNFFTSPSIEDAIATLPDINDDRLPSRSHQVNVHKLAKAYLSWYMNIRQHNERLKEMRSQFEAYPLLGLEITDEALVLFKNNPRDSPLNEMRARSIGMGYMKYESAVTKLRGGRPRRTTTPTLRHGGKRRR